MAFNNVVRTLDCIAASNLAQYVVVTPDTTTNNQVVLASANGFDAIGVVYQATVATGGQAVNIAYDGDVKVMFAASCGPGQRVGVASTNGAVGPLIATGAAPSGATARVYSIGISMEAHAAGDLGTIRLNTREFI